LFTIFAIIFYRYNTLTKKIKTNNFVLLFKNLKINCSVNKVIYLQNN